MSTDVLVYCNGDSFVNGYELGDDLITGHPGYYDFTLPHYYKQKYDDWYSKTFDINHELGKERNDKSKLIFDRQSKLAFPNIIQQKSGIKVINAATNFLGNSQESISRNSITDLYFLKQKYKKIYAIISLTSINRLTVPKLPESWEMFMLSNPPNQDDDYNKGLSNLYDFYIDYSSEYHLLVDWYKNVILLQNFCKLNDIVLLLTTGFPPYDNKEYKNKLDLEAYRGIANIQFDVDMPIIAENLHNDVLCPGNHFSPRVHDRVADLFIEIINNS